MKLSICIPTRNFGPYISRAIESIVSQGEEGIQIVILDSGSTDNTREIVQKYQNEYHSIDYIYEEKAEGIDKGIEKVVSYSKASYCWLLSADDALVSGSLKKILSLINQDYDVLLCNRFWCDKELKILKEEFWRKPVEKNEFFSFNIIADTKYYLDTSYSLGALFSFMSCIGFKKSSWDNMNFGPRYLGTNYAHVPRLMKICEGEKGLLYIRDPLILCRSGNDSFRSEGLLARMLIDLRAYTRFGQDLFPDTYATQKKLYHILKREHGNLRWIKAFLLSSSIQQKEEALTLLKSTDYNHWLYKLLCLMNRCLGCRRSEE